MNKRLTPGQCPDSPEARLAQAAMETHESISSRWERTYEAAAERARKVEHTIRELEDRIREMEERVAYWKEVARTEAR